MLSCSERTILEMFGAHGVIANRAASFDARGSEWRPGVLQLLLTNIWLRLQCACWRWRLGVRELTQTIPPESKSCAVREQAQPANPTKNAIETMKAGLKFSRTSFYGKPWTRQWTGNARCGRRCGPRSPTGATEQNAPPGACVDRASRITTPMRTPMDRQCGQRTPWRTCGRHGQAMQKAMQRGHGHGQAM